MLFNGSAEIFWWKHTVKIREFFKRCTLGSFENKIMIIFSEKKIMGEGLKLDIWVCSDMENVNLGCKFSMKLWVYRGCGAVLRCSPTKR